MAEKIKKKISARKMALFKLDVKHSVQCFHMQKHSSFPTAKMRHHASLRRGPDTHLSADVVIEPRHEAFTVMTYR